MDESLLIAVERAMRSFGNSDANAVSELWSTTEEYPATVEHSVGRSPQRESGGRPVPPPRAGDWAQSLLGYSDPFVRRLDRRSAASRAVVARHVGGDGYTERP